MASHDGSEADTAGQAAWKDRERRGEHGEQVLTGAKMRALGRELMRAAESAVWRQKAATGTKGIYLRTNG